MPLPAILALLLLSVVITGCRTAPQSLEPPVKVGKPIMDFSVGWGGLPVGDAGTTVDEQTIVPLMTDSLKQRLTKDSTPPRVETAGATGDTMDELIVTLDGASVDPGYRPRNLPDARATGQRLQARRFVYSAAPLRYQSGSTYLVIEAQNAIFDLLTGSDGRQTLALRSADTGSLSFVVPMSDLPAMLQHGGTRGGLRINEINIALRSDHPRQLSMEVHLRGRWTLLPMRLRIAAAFEIDDQFRARFTEVGAWGENVGGMLAATFVENALRKQADALRPIALWADPAMKVRDVRYGARLCLDL
ncbi:MAG TPA: hypothetical protein PKB10_05055 [Tepidisphaeraceae bacterium]|nr:hypothetical protein [Tepidisphaeraceae bacterium]